MLSESQMPCHRVCILSALCSTVLFLDRVCLTLQRRNAPMTLRTPGPRLLLGLHQVVSQVLLRQARATKAVMSVQTVGCCLECLECLEARKWYRRSSENARRVKRTAWNKKVHTVDVRLSKKERRDLGSRIGLVGGECRVTTLMVQDAILPDQNLARNPGAPA